MKTTLFERHTWQPILIANKVESKVIPSPNEDIFHRQVTVSVTLSDIVDCDMSQVEKAFLEQACVQAEIEEYNWDAECGVVNVQRNNGNCESVVLACRRCVKIHEDLDCKRI